MPEDSLFSAPQLAQMLKLPVDTILRYTHSGLIPYATYEEGLYSYNPEEINDMLTQDLLRYKLKYEKHPFTVKDNMKLPETVLRTEILDGVLIQEPASTTCHQLILSNIFMPLYEYFASTDPTGEVFLSPLDIILSDTMLVQPDMFYISSQRRDFITKTWIMGPPDLAVEIISPSSARKDRIIKYEIYQRFAIPHYWMVDIKAKLIEFYALDKEGMYNCIGIHSSGTIAIPGFTGLILDLDALWA